MPNIAERGKLEDKRYRSLELQPHEERILDLLSQGHRLKDVAAIMKAPHQTTVQRMRNIRLVLGAKTTEEALYKWALMKPREKLHMPETRTSKTHKAVIMSEHGDAKAYITLGRFPQGQLGELFVVIGSQGSTLRGLLDSWARMVSISLQWGVPPADIIDKFKGVAFEPSGPTENPNIPKCSSIVDYTVRWLELEVNGGERKV